MLNRTSRNTTSLYTGPERVPTYREMYNTNFPVRIADFAQPAGFDAFDIEMHSSGLMGMTRMHGTQDMPGPLAWAKPCPSFDSQEVIDLIKTHEDLVCKSVSPDGLKTWKVEARRQVGAFDYHDGRDFHADGITAPDVRIYFASNAAPTLVVSHKDTLDIFERHNPAFLDMKLPKSHEEKLFFFQTMKAMSSHFKEAASPLDPYAVYAVNGATIHARDENTPDGRVFLIALVL